MSDREAIEAVKNGDRERFAELVERHQKMVYGIAWSRLGDAALCEDAAQETFIKAFRCLVALRNPEKFPAWLGRIARNVSTSIMRARVSELDRATRWGLEQSKPGGGAAGENELLGETLRKTLGDLPQPQRECLVLFYLESKSIREGAAALGISEAAMKTRLHRARLVLRERLEERLEASLAELAPGTNFTAGVMVLLPSTPLMAGGVGGVSILGKALGKALAPLCFMLVFSLFQGLVMALFFGWLGRLEKGNLIPGPGRAIRERQISSTVTQLALVATLTIAGVALLGQYGGQYAVYNLILFLWILGLYQNLRLLRVNQTPFVMGQLASCMMMLVAFVFIRFFGSPYWIFFVGLILMNILLYQTNKSRPARHDYSLFLRGAMGKLGAPDGSFETADSATSASLKAFARFLGNRFLIQDYRLSGTGISLTLAYARPGLSQFTGFVGGGTSRARIGYDGQCDASIGKKDLRDIRALVETGPVEATCLEGCVAAALQGAFRLFGEGRLEEAEALLQCEQDTQVFELPTGQSREHKLRGRIAIVAAVAMLPLFFFSRIVDIGTSDYWQRAKPVSQAMAREAMAGWSKDPSHNLGSIRGLLGGLAHPSADFIGEANLPQYRNAAAHYLFSPGLSDASVPLQEAKDPREWRYRITHALSSPRDVLNLLDAKLFSPGELNDFGISPKTLRAYLTTQPEGALTFRFEAHTTKRVGEGGGVTVPTMSSRAHLVEFLAYFECLDLLEGDLSASDIVAHQVGPDWVVPAGYMQADPAKAAGLFNYGWCDLSMTWGSLRILQLLGELDSIDREACIQGILRFHRGRGSFRAAPEDTGIRMYETADDTFYAMESLHILGALDQIDDFKRWRFDPMTTVVEGKDGERVYGIVAASSIRSWAYQERLEELRGY